MYYNVQDAPRAHGDKEICTHIHRRELELARDLVNVFPASEFALLTFAEPSSIVTYPRSGEFVDKATALSLIPGMRYTKGGTYTGWAIGRVVKMLENER